MSYFCSMCRDTGWVKVQILPGGVRVNQLCDCPSRKTISVEPPPASWTPPVLSPAPETHPTPRIQVDLPVSRKRQRSKATPPPAAAAAAAAMRAWLAAKPWYG